MAFDANDLSPHEHFVMERTRAGEIADFTPIAGPDGSKPSVRAGFLRKLLLGLDPSWAVRPPGVRIKGARIEGALDLTDFSGAGGAMPALMLEACEAPDPIDLSRARVARLTLRDCRLRQLLAAETVVEGALSIAGARAHGPAGAETFVLDASNARIGGNFSATGAALARATESDGAVLRLDGADIAGNVLLDGGFEALGAVSLARTRIGGALRCADAQLLGRSDDAKGAALIARGVRVDGEVRLGGKCKAEGVVDFSGAIIGADFALPNSVFRNEFGDALLLTHADIGGQLIGSPKIYGHASLRGAKIGGDLDFSGIEIANAITPRGDTYGVALDAAGLQVEGAAKLQGANIKGEIALVGARIRCALSFSGGRFMNANGWAVRATGLRVGGDLALKIEDGGFAPHGQKTVIEGGAQFDRAHIAGAVVWHNLELRGPGPDNTKGGVLSLAGAEIAGPLQARALVTHQDARLDLSEARCAALDDDLKTGWGAESARLLLDGFTYSRFGSDERARARTVWLKRTPRFCAQPYTEAANAYARAGRSEDARRILLAQRDQRTLFASAGPITFVLSSLFGLLAGYGLAPLRLMRALALFFALGVAGVFAMNGQGALVTPEGRQCAGAVEPALYAIDVALPVIDLGHASACSPGRTARAELPTGMEVSPYSDWRVFEGVAIWRWAHALYALLGAILTALVVVTFSGVMRPKGK